MNEVSQPIEDTENLLWTGGWDSTFRLLERLFIEKRATQPWYIIDPDRKSFHYEIRTMSALVDRIRARLLEPDLLGPTRFILRNDIPVDKAVSRSFQELVGSE